ncbi:hypothetical protein [Methylocystis echinoides]|uniref:Uncharacterized protein n=1 Tax=Methylocystis echinoides TaxID=29468 RepID=A0A9W6GXD1_9HYPH|nr:hypothetical protein [Methylocystis echinoides]GLI94681.1 hypothetical protein LMG27198_36730 [Methylocystis echinoides]
MRDRPLMIRARRTAASTQMGRELLEFIESPEISAKLKDAARKGEPPAGAISPDLLARFAATIREDAVKRRAGLFIAAVLDAAGFAVVRANVRIKDRVFSTASIYAPRPPEPEPEDLITRIANSMTETEAYQIIGALTERFPSLKKMLQ